MSELLASFIGLSSFQWVMLGLAGVLVAPMVWNKVKGLIPERKPVPVPPPVPPPVVIPHDDPVDCDLVDVVECWEHLIACCEANGMTEAANEIYKVFPLFAKKESS